MPKCPTCQDVGWVCEKHPDRPWDKNVPGGCTCDAGMPCPVCNVAEGGEAPRLPVGMKASFDRNGSRH
jgi:hypothetical protein